MKPSETTGHVIWLTGISGSGKSTLGAMLAQHLSANSLKQVEFLDGDAIREFFENDLGYTKPERIANVKRVAFGAYLLAKNGVLAVVANIAPYYEVRDFIRKKILNYTQIYLKTSLSKVAQRDVKGYYQNFDKGQQNNLIGLDDPYEEPRTPDLIIQTDQETIEDSFNQILSLLKKQNIL